MSGNLLERTRALHEDIDRLEQAAVEFLLEEPRTVSILKYLCII